MRRTLLLSTVALVLLAACGSDDDTAVAGSDPDSPVSNAPDPTGSDPGTGQARIVQPTPGLDGVVATAIDSVAALAGDELEVRFYGGVEECYGVDHVGVEESATDVTISVFTGTRPDAAGRACIELAELQAVMVMLDAPLGDRALLDGSSGTPIAVG